MAIAQPGAVVGVLQKKAEEEGLSILRTHLP